MLLGSSTNPRRPRHFRSDSQPPHRSTLTHLWPWRNTQALPACRSFFSSGVHAFHLLSQYVHLLAPSLLLPAVDPAKTGCTATAVLLYCYYGGMLETGRRRYSHALELFLAAITAPTYVVNAITVAALKKFILVALLHHGEVPPLPKHTAPAVSRGVKSEAGTYYDLSKHVAAAVRSGEATELCGFVTSRSDVWNDDGNTGLVQLVTARTSRRRVQALTHTYLTLTLPDVAAMAGLGSAGAAEDAVLGMVDGGEVEGRISEREGMVRFSDDNEENGAGESSPVGPGSSVHGRTPHSKSSSTPVPPAPSLPRAKYHAACVGVAMIKVPSAGTRLRCGSLLAGGSWQGLMLLSHLSVQVSRWPSCTRSFSRLWRWLRRWRRWITLCAATARTSPGP